VRLIRQDKIDEFAAMLREFQEQLAEAVETLDRRYSELKATARNRLGSLYNPSDYPASLRGLFSIEFDFPSVEPPDYLQQLNPQLYEQECQRVQSRFDEAVKLAEEAFTAELAELVSHLTERLSGTEDGRPKIFRDSMLENLTEFFQRFRQLNVRSSEQLDQLVSQAQQVIRGVEPQSLRDNEGLRQHVATEMSQVQSVLDGLLVDRPRRAILCRPK
jgi:AcrR family transcriptional regulator